ncbi:MAG: phospho-N-acetylmuramoyl-pentapeptide-transferase, partial [Chloroflexota bacterium]|nr:phospho-N-acetylmuramoyl-pentapeptide-transferase [Chloroflexota bacterium]
MIETPMSLALSAFSFLLTVIWGPPLLRVLRNLKIGERIRIDGPRRHLSKLGTPTMGGILIVIPVLFLTILFNAGSLFGLSVFGNSILVPLIVLILYALIGSVDDWAGLRGQKDSEGLSPRMKLIAQTIVALGTALVLHYFLHVPELYLPGLNFEISLGVLYIPIAMFIIVATSNAINLTDGLDGLAGLISVTAFITYGAIAIMQGQIFLARFCFILVGAIFGFLWFNVYPAELFMGDTGSLSLGAA